MHARKIIVCEIESLGFRFSINEAEFSLAIARLTKQTLRLSNVTEQKAKLTNQTFGPSNEV